MDFLNSVSFSKKPQNEAGTVRKSAPLNWIVFKKFQCNSSYAFQFENEAFIFPHFAEKFQLASSFDKCKEESFRHYLFFKC